MLCWDTSSPPGRLIPSLLAAFERRQPIETTHGGQLRDFTHASDIADLLVRLLFSPEAGAFNVGDINQNGLLDPGETWRYEATQTATTMGPYINAATVTALSPAGLPVQAQTLSNHLNECPVVINVQRFGIHQQPTQLVVTFNGPLDPAQAQNVNNYHVFTLGPNGKFTRPVPVASAVTRSTGGTMPIPCRLQMALQCHRPLAALTSPDRPGATDGGRCRRSCAR